MRQLYAMYQASRLKRWHTVEGTHQNLADHSWGVAMICVFLGAEPSTVVAALTHDLHEKEFGDIPYQVKRDNPLFAEAEQVVMDRWADRHGYRYIKGLPPLEQEILKWADMFEAHLFSYREWVVKGNADFKGAYFRSEEAISRMGYPNEAARLLHKEVCDEQRTAR